MKFILDAHLPPSLCDLFIARNHSIIHTKDLPNKNDTSDKDIIKVANSQNRIVITKDSDFYYSHIIKREPSKLLMVKTGNLSTKATKKIFKHYFEQIIAAFKNSDIVELHRDSLIF